MARVQGLAEALGRHSGQANGTSIGMRPGMFEPQPGPATQSPLTRNIFPPWVYKLPMSQDFNANVFTIALAGVIGTRVVVASFQMPPTFIGYMQIVGIYILSPTNAQTITFTLRFNGAPVQGFDNIKFPPGTANFVIQNFGEMQVRIPDGALVTLTADNGSADAWTVGGKLSGWYHPSSEEKRIYGDL